MISRQLSSSLTNPSETSYWHSLECFLCQLLLDCPLDFAVVTPSRQLFEAKFLVLILAYGKHALMLCLHKLSEQAFSNDVISHSAINIAS